MEPPGGGAAAAARGARRRARAAARPVARQGAIARRALEDPRVGAGGARSRPGLLSDLDRFVDAQARVYDAALAELRAGAQDARTGCGSCSPRSRGSAAARRRQRFYAIASLDEARGVPRAPRPRAAAARVRPRRRRARGRSAEEVFGADRRREAAVVDDAVLPRRRRTNRVSRGARPLLRRRGRPGHVGAALTSCTHIHLLDVEDAAPANGFGERWEGPVARTALGAEQTGVTHFRLCGPASAARSRTATSRPRRST